MNPRNLLVPVCLCLVLLMPVAQAEASLGLAAQEDQDVAVAYASTSGAASTRFDLDLRRLQDSNADGDFGDAGEDVSLTSITDRAVADCNGNAEVSCTFTFATSDAFIVWRNATNNHIQGNYSLTLVFENAIGAVIQRFRTGIRIIPSLANTSALGGHNGTIITQHISQNTNATGHNGTMLDGHGLLFVDHDSIVFNQVDQGLHRHAGGPDTNTSDNQTLARFTTDCHGTGQGLCVNGHAPVQIVQDWTVLALAVGILVALAWGATQRSTLLPMLAFFGGLGCFILLLQNRTVFSSSAPVVDVVSALAFIVMTGGGLAFIRYRAEKTST